MAENDQKTELTPKERRALEALLSGKNKGEAALAAGVQPRTLSRWLASPHFRAELTAVSDLALKDAAVSLKSALGDAVGVMAGIMKDEGVSPTVRLRAADMVASHSIKITEAADLLERIEALEARR